MKRLSVQQDNELGLMLDIGRKYFSADDLFELIDEMHQLGYNLLHLHFSENERFGLECALLKQPCLNGILTKMQLTEVVDYARKHNIAVMGELGMPGHMGAILKQYPHLRLVGSNGQPLEHALNLSDKESMSLCKALIHEFSPYFNYNHWHLGADEYLSPFEFANNQTIRRYAQKHLGPTANGQDGFFFFLNLLGYFLADLGLRPRVWGDSLSGGSVMHVNSDFLIDYWTDRLPSDPCRPLTAPSHFAKLGHKLVNCSWTPCYYVMHSKSQVVPGFFCKPDLEQMEQNWSINCFGGADHESCVCLDQKFEHKFVGIKMQVWCDQPDLMSANALIETIKPQMQFIAAKYHEYQVKALG